jgi:hypothetical protein
VVANVLPNMHEVRRLGETYVAAFDETMCLNLEQATNLLVVRYTDDVRRHSLCNMESEQGCKVSEKQLIDRYGTIEAANAAGKFPTDCAEDLMFLYDQLGHLTRLLYELRQARMSPEEDWVQEQMSSIKAATDSTAGLPRLSLDMIDDNGVAVGRYPVLSPKPKPELRTLYEGFLPDDGSEDGGSLGGYGELVGLGDAEGHDSKDSASEA